MCQCHARANPSPHRHRSFPRPQTRAPPPPAAPPGTRARAVHAARPLRLAAGLALAPAGDWLIDLLSSRLRVGRLRALGAALAADAVLLLCLLAAVVLLSGGAR